MLSVEFSSIPVFLQNSELYKIFHEQEDPIFEINPKYYVVDTNITSPEKFTALMETIRYWGLESLPDFVFQYMLLHNRALSLYPPFKESIAHTIYEQELLFLLQPLDIEGCIIHGYSNIVNYLISTPIPRELIIVENNIPEGDYYPIEPEKNILAHNLIEKKTQFFTKIAAQYGQLTILKMLDNRGFRIDHNTIISAVVNGHNDCLEYIAKKHTERLFNYHITIIGYAISSKNEKSVEIMLKYITPYTFSKVSAEIMCDCVNESTFEIFKLIYPFWKKKVQRTRNLKSILENIAEKRRLQFLQHIYQEEKHWISDTANIMASHGYLEGLQFVIENGATYNQATCAIAAYKDEIDCVKYLHNQGVEFCSLIIDAAAENGNLACIKYLHENGCPWTSSLIIICKAYGYKECLQYALKNGCPSPYKQEVIVDDEMNIFVNGHQIQKMENILNA
jgi:hypothetical protein